MKKLRILIADPDRDFLVSYEKLVSGDGHEPVIVFDGTQVLSAVSGNNIEIVILSENIPRISCREIVSLLNEMNIPVVVTMEKNPGADRLRERCDKRFTGSAGPDRGAAPADTEAAGAADTEAAGAADTGAVREPGTGAPDRAADKERQRERRRHRAPRPCSDRTAS